MTATKAIQVELFGIARQRAGVAQLSVAVDALPVRLTDLLKELRIQCPPLAEACLDGDRLRAGFVANVAGDRFVTDPQTLLLAGQSLLILSADAGG